MFRGLPNALRLELLEAQTNGAGCDEDEYRGAGARPAARPSRDLFLPVRAHGSGDDLVMMPWRAAASPRQPDLAGVGRG
jgi:hypothetical protein